MPPPLTQFEQQLSDLISTAWGAGSGTVWTASSRLVEKNLELGDGTVGLISVTEENVINNRPLSAGLITKPRKFLIVCVADVVGMDRQELAIKALMPKTRHLTTVGIACKVPIHDGSGGSAWRVQRLIEVEGLGIAEHVLPYFPMVSEICREPLAPFGLGKHDDVVRRVTWLMKSENIHGRTVTIRLPPYELHRRKLTPGDKVLLCDHSRRWAHGAGVVERIHRDGPGLAVVVTWTTRFKTLVELGGSHD